MIISKILDARTTNKRDGYKFKLLHYNRKETGISYLKYNLLSAKMKNLFYLDDSVSIREFIGSGWKIEIHLTMFTMIVK